MKVGCKRILIIDRDRQAAQELSSLFIDHCYKVETCECIREAAKIIKDVKFDCIILDVDLPEMKGYEAVSILKAINPKVQIIMTTENNSMDLEAQVRKEDIFYYYIKSFDRDELIEAVRDVFKKVEPSFRKEMPKK